MFTEHSAVISPKQRENLVHFFGEKGADIVISHIDDLDKAFGTASTVIRLIMREAEDCNKQFTAST